MLPEPESQPQRPPDPAMGPRDGEEVRKCRALFEHSPLGICWSGPDGRLQEVNPAFQAMVGYGEAELLGTPIWRLTHPEDLAEHMAYREAIVHGRRKNVRTETRWVRKDGAVIWVRITASPMVDPSGKVVLVFGTICDITEERSTREALEERRRAETMERLRLLEMEAEMRQQAVVGTLLEGVAHDYNNLLQAILTSVDVAMACTTPGTELHKLLDYTRIASSQASQLSRRLHSLNHPREGEERVGPVAGLVRSTLEALVPPGLVALEFDFEEGDPPVRHDATALGRALGYLVDNALEAMPLGGTLRASTRVREGGDPDLPPGPWLQLTLRDTGRGISPGDLPMVFEPYFTTKPRGVERGTGLGLALCESIVRAHGGRMLAESSVGKGASFHVLLPLESPPGSPA